MTDDFKELDVVALTEDVPAEGLKQGQVGTIVMEYGGGDYEVEFVDSEGQTYAMLPLRRDQLMLLRFNPSERADSAA